MRPKVLVPGVSVLVGGGCLEDADVLHVGGTTAVLGHAATTHGR